MRSSQNKPELKDIKSRNVQEEGDHGVFRSPSQGRSDALPPHQFYPRSSKWRLQNDSKSFVLASSILANCATFLIMACCQIGYVEHCKRS